MSAAPLRCLAALLVGLASTAGAQAAPAPRPAPRPVTQTASTNPLATPFGFLSAEYERALGRHGFAVGVGALSSFGEDPQAPNDGGSDVFRSAQLKLKFYPRQEGLRGFAIGITAGVAHERQLAHGFTQYDAFGNVTFQERVTSARTAPTIGTTVDYNFFLGRSQRFLVGLGLGARRAFGVGESGPLAGPLIDPRVQFGFGF
jgi:hypothetical protein